MGFLDGLFGNRISAEERERVITYLTAEWTLRAFQDEVGGEYNAVMMEWGGKIGSDPQAAEVAARAAAIMIAQYRRVVHGHVDLKPIPDVAGECYFAWHSTYLALTAWAEAVFAMFDALTRDTTTQTTEWAGRRTTNLLRDEEMAREGATKAEGRLLKRIRATPEEVRSIMSESEKAVSGWREVSDQ